MKFYRLSDATFYDRINTTYQFIKPFLDKKKKKNAYSWGIWMELLKSLIEYFFFFTLKLLQQSNIDCFFLERYS